MSQLFFKNRHLLILTILVMLVSGGTSYFTLPRLEDPHIIPRFGLILSRYPGATAERVEALVTEKIEIELSKISEIREVKSTSRTGISVITVELEEQINEPEPLWSKIRSQLNNLQSILPEGVTPIFDEKRTVAVANSLVVALVWKAETEPQLNVLNRLAQEFAEQLRNIPGTEFVEIFGAPQEEILIQFEAQELASLGKSTSEIAHLIHQADSKVGAGFIRTSKNDLILEVTGELDSLARIGQIPVVQLENGQLLRLKDIARIQKSHLTPERESAIAQGDRAILLGARVEKNSRIDFWMERAQEALVRFQQEEGVAFLTLYDQTKYTNSRLESLKNNLFFGMLIVISIVFLMMGFYSALLVGIALPLSTACVLFGLSVLEVPIQQMSVTGLIIALGLLIDNAIVIVDETRFRLKSGAPKSQALTDGISFLFLPLLGSTLTTVLAFMPIILLEGPIGEFTGSIAISVIIAILSSFAISMTLIPTLTVIFYKTPKQQENSPSFWSSGIQSKTLSSLFKKSLRVAIKFPLIGLFIGLIFPTIGFWKKSELRDQFFPTSDRDQFYIQLYLQPDTAIKQTQKRVQSVDDFLRQHTEIQSTFWTIGRSAPSVYYNMISFQDDLSNFAEGVIQARSAEDVARMIPALQKKLDAEFSDTQFVIRAFGQGPPVDSPLEVQIYGPNLKILRELGEEIRLHLSETSEVTHTSTTLLGGKPKMAVSLSEEDANFFGITLVEASKQLEASFEGVLGGSVLEDTEELPVRIRFSDEQRQTIQNLYSFNFVSKASDSWIPLGALGQVHLVPELSQITRRDHERVNIIQGYIQLNALPEEVLNRFLKRLETHSSPLPKGYRLEIGGDSSEKKEAVSKLLAYLFPLATLMVATIVLSFQSFLMAGFIGIVILFSFGLSFFSTWCYGVPFGFMSFLGTAGLIGIAINDSIVVLAAIRANPEARSGNLEAILHEVLHSSRHVWATTLTTVGGFCPLILSGGGFWPPLAIVIAGGVSAATLIALYFIPTLYFMFSKFSK